MEKKNTVLSSEETKEEQRIAPEDSTPQAEPAPTDEEHAHGNYLFALKVLAVLVAIIVVIMILKASGVRISIKDWFAGCISVVPPVFPNIPPSLF